MTSKIKRAFNYLFNRMVILRMDFKSAANIRKKLELIVSQDKSILDKYGFIQNTDKASVNGGG